MKKLLFIILMLAFLFPVYSQKDNLELGIRYLKLGNTYREAKLFDKAGHYINEGKKIAVKNNSIYWQAVSNEYLGYFYRDISMKAEAMKNFLDALELFAKSVNQKDGSPAAIKSVIEKISNEMNEIQKDAVSAVAGLDLTDSNNFKDTEKQFKNFVYNNLRDANANPDNVYVLDLDDQDLTTLPSSIGNFRNLEVLILSNNELSQLPEDICMLKNLTVLELQNNSFTKLPECIYKMKSLELLNLKGNEFSIKQLVDMYRLMPAKKIIIDDDSED